MPKKPARLRVRADPLDMVLRSDSTRMADRDLGLPVDAGGDSPTVPESPEWLPFTPEESCSSNGMSVGIRKPDLNFSTVNRESCSTRQRFTRFDVHVWRKHRRMRLNQRGAQCVKYDRLHFRSSKIVVRSRGTAGSLRMEFLRRVHKQKSIWKSHILDIQRSSGKVKQSRDESPPGVHEQSIRWPASGTKLLKTGYNSFYYLTSSFDSQFCVILLNTWPVCVHRRQIYSKTWMTRSNTSLTAVAHGPYDVHPWFKLHFFIYQCFHVNPNFYDTDTLIWSRKWILVTLSEASSGQRLVGWLVFTGTFSTNRSANVSSWDGNCYQYEKSAQSDANTVRWL